MKAIVKYKEGKGFVELRDVEVQTAGPGNVRIQVEYAGICASDLHILNYDIAITIKPPVVMGHEFSGTIDQVGEGVEGWQVGDRVVAEASYWFCGECRYCREGFYNMCGKRQVLGYFHNGAFAPHTVVPAKRLHALPPEISFQQGALIEPTACVTHGMIEMIQIEKGSTVLVTGPGAIGLTAVQVAKAAGATVIVSGMPADRERLELARKLGADRVVDVTQEDLKKATDGMTEGYGVDVAVECAGNARAVVSALECLRKHGQYLQMGLQGSDMQLRFDIVAYKELKITGALSSRDVSWRSAIDLIRKGQIKPEACISHILPLDAWEEAFRLHADRKGLKILFKPE